MHNSNTSTLRRTIGTLKKNGSPTNTQENQLMSYLDTEEQIDLIFQSVREEDSLGRFYCLVLLQKAVGLVGSRTEGELDRFIGKTKRMIEEGVGSGSEVEMRKTAALYSSLAVLYWPIKLLDFVRTISALMEMKNRLGVEIFEQFLSQVTDSLEITEERRYELKKNISPVVNELFLQGVKNFSKDELIGALTWMCRLNVALETTLGVFFKDWFMFREEVAVLIGELSIASGTKLFENVSEYLWRSYAEMKKKSPELVSLLLECASSFGNQANPKVMGSGSFDLLMREGVFDSAHELRDLIEGEVVLGILKTYTSRMKGYLMQKNGKLEPKRKIEEQEDVVMALGANPARFTFALSELHASPGFSSNDMVLRTLEVVGASFPQFTTEFLMEVHENIPQGVSETLLKYALAPVAFTSAYLALRQSIHRKEYSESAVRRTELKTGKECGAVKEALEELQREGRLDPGLVMDVYRRAMEISGYYSLDLAVECGALLGRKDLVLRTMQGFEGKGVAAFVAAITKCPEVVAEVFEQFQRHFLNKENDLTNEIDAIAKILQQNSVTKLKSSGTKMSAVPQRADAVALLGRAIVEKIFSKIEEGSFHELKKIAKIVPYLVEGVHSAFIYRLWGRLKKEIEKQNESGDYSKNGDIQSVLQAISSECAVEEASVLYEIVELGEYPVRGVLSGIRAILESGSAVQLPNQIEPALVSMLVAIYTAHSEENIRATIAGLLSDTPERIAIMENMYSISLAEVQSSKDKRAAMKKVLRRVEGMKEKKGAILQKAPKRIPDDRWSEMATLF